MRVLHVTQRYWPAVGGAENYLREISTRLAQAGHQVTVATTDALDLELFWNRNRRRVAQATEEMAGVVVRRFPVRHTPAPQFSYPAIRRLLWLLSAARPLPPTLLFRLARLTPWVPDLWRWLATTREPFDLAAGTTICFEPLIEAGLRFARRRGIPFVIYPLTHLGAGPRPGQDPLSRFYTMRHQVALALASDAIVAQTPAERDFYVARGAHPARVLICGPGVTPEEVLGGDGQRFRQRHQIAGPLVASLCAMSYDKGVVHLVEATRQLWRAGHSLDLVLAGAVLEPFQRYLETLPPEDRQRLHVLGTVDDQEKRDLLAAADVFAMPSRTDSFGIVYLEAWLYRKPVIGAHTWGVSDVITDGEDGLLVPFGDVAALTATIARLLDDPALRQAIGERGARKVIEHHRWERKFELIHDLYVRLGASGEL